MTRTIRPLAAAALLAVSAPGAAEACSLCACGDPLLAASDPAAINGVLRFQLDTEYVRVRAGSEAGNGATDELTQWSYRFNVVYKPTEALSLTATLPVVTKVMRTVGAGPAVTTSRLSRLGDVELAGRWTAWRSANLGVGRVHELAVTGGTSLPTGEAQATDPAGRLVDPHGQVGSGAFGPFLGLSYLVEQGSWLAFASASYRYRTDAVYFDDSQYQVGAALLWSAHAQFRPGRRVALDLGVDGRWAAADRATAPSGTLDPAVPNTGGTVLSAAPGVYVDVRGGAWIFVRAQLPFVKRLRGEQDVLPSFTTGLQLQAF